MTPITPKVYEDLPSRTVRPVLQRRLSEPDLTKCEAMDAMTARKQGHFWECIHHAHDRYGGYLYTFRFKELYDDPYEVAKVVEKIHPAVEYLRHGFDWMSEAESKFFALFGIRIEKRADGLHHTFPDEVAFRQRWRRLQEAGRVEGEFDLFAMDGIADDGCYIERLCIHDCLLSTTKEFIHDWNFHLIQNLHFIFHHSSRIFFLRKRAFNRRISTTYHRVMSAGESVVNRRDKRVLRTCLSAFVDVLSNHNFPWVHEDYFLNYLNNHGYQPLFRRLYPNQDLSYDRLKAVWEQIHNLRKRKREAL